MVRRCPGLLEFVRTRGRDFDRVLFFTYRYAPSWFGLPLVADRAILVPTAEHDQLIRSSTILAPFFRLPRAYLFLTPEEEEMVATVARAALPPSAVIGSGIDPAPDRPSRAALDALGIPQDFLVYLGRVDRNKGCDALVRHYGTYVASAGAGAATLPLILAGPVKLRAARAARAPCARPRQRRRPRRPALARPRPGDAVALREPQPGRARSVEPRHAGDRERALRRPARPGPPRQRRALLPQQRGLRRRGARAWPAAPSWRARSAARGWPTSSASTAGRWSSSASNRSWRCDGVGGAFRLALRWSETGPPCQVDAEHLCQPRRFAWCA